MIRNTFLALAATASLGAASAATAATLYLSCPITSELGFSVTVYLPGGPAFFFYNPGDHSTFTFEPGGVYLIELRTQGGSKTLVANVSGTPTEDLQITYDGNTSDPGVLTPGQHFVENEANLQGRIAISRHVGDEPSQADRDKAAALKELAEATYTKLEAGQ
jgi:hypothetical protein